jgi:hypothetical protein
VNSNGIFHTIERKQAIAQSSPQRHTTIARAAASLSRRNVDQSIVELFNTALGRLVELCYECDDADGRLSNVDPATGRVLVALPWGKMGYKKWGLTQGEGDTMRAIMFTRQRIGLPLFFYDRSRRSWFLNLADYPDCRQILDRFHEWEVSVEEYRKARAAAGR